MNTQNTNEYLKLEITETARDCLKGDSYRLSDAVTEEFNDMEGIKDFLKDRYGHVPNGRRKIYRDPSGGAEEIGFLYSFWNKDWSHNSKSWYQTDWITIVAVAETPVLMGD